MPKMLTFLPKTKKEWNKKVDLMVDIKQIQALYANTITPADVEYTLKRLEEIKNLVR
ncbi:hypothetical protein QUW13_02795 [Enterococcus hirae]|nr:hypothetical protein [Enterococcus hirae]